MRAAFRIVALSAALLAACGRGGAIESEPGPVYLIRVENPMSHPMDVWYDDGRETSELGRVEAGATREFVIAGPASSSVEVVARDDGRTHTVNLPVELTRAGTRIVLTP